MNAFQDINSLKNKLKSALENTLPGAEYQYLMAPEIRISGSNPDNARNAAVMALFFPEDECIKLVFIRRNEYPGVHSGQVSFPGGMQEKYDASLKDTALRETGEETGIDPDKIDVIGKTSPLLIPVSNFIVHPFIGLLDHKPEFHPDKSEVSYLIIADLQSLFSPASCKSELRTLANQRIKVPYYLVNEDKIWGATAMMLSELLEIIARAEQL